MSLHKEIEQEAAKYQCPCGKDAHHHCFAEEKEYHLCDDCFIERMKNERLHR